MPRGRLIFPFVVEIARIDTAGTAADPTDADPARPADSGYDPIYREPIKAPTGPSDTVGVTARVELPVVQIPAQIEAEMFERLEMLLSGHSPQEFFRVVLHFKDIERLGLTRPDGTAAFSIGDRLVRILHKKDLSLVQDIPDPPAMHAFQVMPRGWGLSPSNARRNLLFLDFRARDRSTR
ncbi:MAG: hypothetical protein MI867_04415 [Pseudomonadales bacterium]|nr:hypothetical protein [Pseudomonadales bacterium]